MGWRAVLVVALPCGWAACAIEFPDYPVDVLGQRCQTDADCAAGFCWNEGSALLASGSPAGGLCTAHCDDATPCPAGHCEPIDGVSLCLQTCSHGVRDPLKCRGRRDLGCAVLAAGNACMPVCNDDSECSEGRVCDRRTSLCAASQSGKEQAPLTLCEAVADPCRGKCDFPVVGNDRRCLELCVKGASVSCQPEAGCVLPAADGAELGDVGVCSPECTGAGDQSGCPPLPVTCSVDCGEHRYCALPGAFKAECE